MSTNEEPVLELLGKTGNPVKIKLFDININCKVNRMKRQENLNLMYLGGIDYLENIQIQRMQ